MTTRSKGFQGTGSRSYLSFTQDELVVAALALAQEKVSRISFEQLVAQCFEMFPKKFELHGYPRWPNAVIVNKSWLRCRTDKHLIAGNVAEGFALTPKGIEVAKRILAGLGDRVSAGGNRVSGKSGDRQTADGRVVSSVEGNLAFKKYLASGTVDSVSEHEFCDVFYALVESDADTLKKNFEAVKSAIESYGRNDLARFLDALKEKFGFRFQSSARRGGMLPRA